MHRYHVFRKPEGLRIHPTAQVQNALFNTESGRIEVGEHVFFGHNVSILTGSHDATRFGLERQLAVPPEGCDVVIEAGAWLCSNVTVVGPCRIGRDAVVAAGAVVVSDVEAGSVVAGVPARRVRRLADGNPKPESQSA